MIFERLLDATISQSHLVDFVNACLDCVVKEMPLRIYKLNNTGYVRTREVFELITPIVPMSLAFQFFDSETEFMIKAAKTARLNCVIDNSKAMAAGLQLPNILEAIDRSVHAWSISCTG